MVMDVIWRELLRQGSISSELMIGGGLVFILKSRLLLYSAGSSVNRVQVVLSGFSVRLLGMGVCISLMHS